MDMCNISVTGYATQPETREMGGKTYISFSIGVGKNRQNPDTGEWTRDTTWFGVDLSAERYGKTAERLAKGDRVSVSGRYEQRTGKNGKVFNNIKPDFFNIESRRVESTTDPSTVDGTNPF